MLACARDGPGDAGMAIKQSELAVILYSSGTTGLVKGVVLTHRNLIASTASFCSLAEEHRTSPHVNLVPVSLFHLLGFTKLLASVAIGEMMVIMESFGAQSYLGLQSELHSGCATGAGRNGLACCCRFIRSKVARGSDLRRLPHRRRSKEEESEEDGSEKENARAIDFGAPEHLIGRKLVRDMEWSHDYQARKIVQACR